MIPVVFVQKQKPQQSAVEDRKRDSAVQQALDFVEPVLTSAEPPAVAWNKAFETKPIGARILSTVFTYLHRQKRYDDAVEGLQAAIRNDHAQPWMYDVLAIEMALAERPQNEINRVLLSRIDFSPGNQAQMLVTASTLAGFDAFEAAMKICREAAKRTPWEPAVWSTARRIATQSKNPKSIIWSQAGTIQHVWQGDYTSLHAVAAQTLLDLEQELTTAGNLSLASQLREALQTAQQRDIHITIQWTGDADLDLSVIEPDGKTCSRKSRLTANGGLLIRQSDGGKGVAGPHTEEYVCPIAKSGEYVVSVSHIHGRVIRGAVIVKAVRYENTPQEQKTQVLETGVVDNAVRVKVQLEDGRAEK